MTSASLDPERPRGALSTDVRLAQQGSGPLLRADNLTKHFPVTRGVMHRVVGQVRAVDGVSFDIAAGETLGLVGESGCGKSTVGRLLLQLLEPTGGSLEILGRDVTHLNREDLKKLRRDVQIIFQDPYSSLNPRMRVFDIVGEALRVHGIVKGDELKQRVESLLSKVGVSPSWVNRFPHEFSGGQRQRIGVARAIAMQPKLVVCDEAVSALDVSIQAQVLNLLMDLREELGLAYLFISHDLSVVRHISHRVAVMYLGQIVELAPVDELFSNPRHPYTRALLSAVPVPNPRAKRRRLVLQGDVPTPLNPPKGCRFHTRCPLVMDRCRREEPDAVTLSEGHYAKCFLAEDEEALAKEAAAAARLLERERENVLESEFVAEADAAAFASADYQVREPATGDTGAERRATGEAEWPTTELSTSGRAKGGSDARVESRSSSSEDAERDDNERRVEQAAQLAEDERQEADYVTSAVSRRAGRSRLANQQGAALCMLGAVLVLADAWIVGACVGMVGYLLVPVGKWTTRHLEYQTPSGRTHEVQRRSFVLFWATWAAMVALSLPLTRKRTEWRAATELQALQSQLESWRTTSGDYPKSLSQLGWRLFEVFPGGEAIDPWGKPYRYRLRDPQQQSRVSLPLRPYWLGSLGPDKALGSDDDIGNLPPAEAPEAAGVGSP